MDNIYDCPAFLEVMQEIREENMNYQPDSKDVEDYYNEELPE